MMCTYEKLQFKPSGYMNIGNALVQFNEYLFKYAITQIYKKKFCGICNKWSLNGSSRNVFEET